jgi:hypothetical protein
MVYGLGAVAGSDGFSTRLQQDFFAAVALLPRDRAVHLLASLGVDRLIGREPLDPLNGLADAVENRDALTWEYRLVPRAPSSYLAERVFGARDTASALARLAEPDFRPGRDAVVLGGDKAMPASGALGEIKEVAAAPGEVEADVALSAPGLWIVTGTWFPGWEGRIDGAVADVLLANGIQRAMRVPAGSHRVAMRYRPRSFLRGVIVSAIAFITLLASTGTAFVRRKGTRP